MAETAKKAVEIPSGVKPITFSHIEDAIKFYDKNLGGQGEADDFSAGMKAVLILINRSAKSVQASVLRNAISKGKSGESELQELLNTHTPKLLGEKKTQWTVTHARVAIQRIIPVLRDKPEVLSKVAELAASNDWKEAVTYLEGQGFEVPMPEIETKKKKKVENAQEK